MERMTLKNAQQELVIDHDWISYFEFNRSHLLFLDYGNKEELNKEEKKLITPSVQAFQLGEGSEGLHLKKAANRFAKRSGYKKYPEMIECFIGEENRHSHMLQKYMEIYEIPRIEHHGLDSVFRFLRKGMGIEGEIMVLVTAEMIALPYYSALSEATGSRLLKTICSQMRNDEYMHVIFQSETLHYIYEHRNPKANQWMAWFRRIFMNVTLAVVWIRYGRVFRRGGFSFLRFFRDCNGLLTDSVRIAKFGSL